MQGGLVIEMKKQILTIIVPVHNISGRLENLSKWLPNAINNNVKVMLVNDGSRDSTGDDLVKLKTSNYSELISIFETDVNSPGLARNVGLEKVDTPWFAFADADDFVVVDGIIKLINGTIKSGKMLGIGAYESQSLTTGKRFRITPPGDNISVNIQHLVKRMGFWRAVYSYEHFGKIRFSRFKMGEDYLYLNQILSSCSSVFLSQEVIYRYYHGGSNNLTSNKKNMVDMIYVLQAITVLRPQSKYGQVFQQFSKVKLSLSIIKNVKLHESFRYWTTLLPILISHPICIVRLFNKRDLEEI